jgi:nicotinate (nicotinamide) nucleotide adenylyltransferase
VSRWETRQSAWSRTCDTVRAHHAAVNARAGWPQPPVQVRLLVGSDMLQSFDVPNLWQPEHMRALLADFGLVVIPRPGVDLDALMARSDTIRPHAANVLVAHEACGYPVSSTIVRRLLLSGQSPRYLVHDRVLDYCLKHGLWAPPAPVPASAPASVSASAAQTEQAGDAKAHGQ